MKRGKPRGDAHRATQYRNVFWRGASLYYSFIDEDGVRRKVRCGEHMTPRDASLLQAEKQNESDRIRTGAEDRRSVAARRGSERPIGDVIDEYIAAVAGRGRSTLYVRKTKAMLLAWADACKVACLRDADPKRFGVMLAELRQADRSARTRNAYRAAVRGLCRWATDHGLCATNPIPSGLIPVSNEEADRRRPDRFLTQDQMHALLASSPPQRAAFYALAGFAGLRFREIARLRWGNFDFDAGVLIVDASQSKNGRIAELPMLDTVAAAMKRIRPADAQRSAKVFRGEVTYQTWKRDLRAARLIGEPPLCAGPSYPGPHYGDAGFIDDENARLERKCLRTSFHMMLVENDVDPRTAQRLMRHSDINLTMKRYTKLRVDPLRRGLERVGTTAGQKSKGLSVSPVDRVDAGVSGVQSKVS